MHFREEYFPHRELGICYFHLARIEEAIEELELSMSQTPSARARYYLNQGRRAYLLKTGLDTSSPVIDLNCPDLINQTPVRITGTVRDDHYVASILVNRKPLFIELAEPSLPFSVPVDLHEGENRIEIMARDLVDREVRQSLTVYLDQQGPRVMVNPIRREREKGQVIVTAVVYDPSGIASFQLNHKEVERSGLDRLCFIEQAFDVQTIPFRAKDRAGNITEGTLSLEVDHTAAMRLAWHPSPDSSMNNAWPLALGAEEESILFDIIHPQTADLTTFYQEIFLEARIEAKKGIRSIELNGCRLFDASRVRAYLDRMRGELIQRLLDQQKDPEKYIRLLQDALDQYTLYYLNQRVALPNEVNDLILLVEDAAGNTGSRVFHIKKIPREEVLKSEQRMTMALLPFDAPVEAGRYRDYINTRCLESFVSQGRFNLVEREKLPWVLIEKTIQDGQETYRQDLARKIGQMTAAEGVICGFIQKREDGTEILARFVEVETGLIRLYHDVFTPGEDKQSLDTIISGLAMKFRDSFPVCAGTITGIEGKIIRVDFGMEKGIFPGMGYNIFHDEQELMARACVREVMKGASEAEITGEVKDHKVETGCRVRTR
jgi:hypothetical protein